MIIRLNWLDYTVIAIIIVYALNGLIKGLLLSIFSMIGFVISIIMAKIASPIVTEMVIKYTSIDEMINKYFNNRKLMTESSSTLIPLLRIFNVNIDPFNGTLTSAIILTVSFIIVFIIIKGLLQVIVSILNIATKIPIIKQFNKIGGLLLGSVKGILILYIIFAVLTPIIALFSTSNYFVSILNNSLFAVNFYRYNFIISWIMGTKI